MNNPMQIIQQFQQFKNNFQGNPRAEVEKLIASGKINQQQLNNLQNMAREFQKMLNNR